MDLYYFDFFLNLFNIFSKYQIVFFVVSTPIIYFSLVTLHHLRNVLSTSLPTLIPKCLLPLSMGILLLYILIVLLYAFSPLYLDHAESSLSIIGFLLKGNFELYPSLVSGNIYGVSYGPNLFLLQKWFYLIFGDSIEASKLVGVLGSISSLTILYLAIRNRNNAKTSLYLIAFVPIAFLQCSSWSFWNRSEPLIMFFMGLALFGIRQKNSYFSLFLLSISFGFAANLKVTSAFYMLPIFILSLKNKSIRFNVATIFITILIVILPFLHKNISFFNYLDLFKLASNEKMHFKYFYVCLRFSFFYYFVPTLLILLYLSKHKENLKHICLEHCFPLTALFVCLVVVMIMGAVEGGGKLYMLPFMPLFVYFWSKLINVEFDFKNVKISNAKLLIIMSLLLGLTFSITPPYALKTGYMLLRFSKNLKKDAVPRQIINDLRNIDNQYPDLTIHMGLGEYKDYKYTYYRPALVYMGNPYYIDFPIYMAYQNANMVNRKQLTQFFETCKIDIWLIPKGNIPFAMGNFAVKHIPLFDQELRNSFLNNYVQINTSKFFDIYKCKIHKEF